MNQIDMYCEVCNEKGFEWKDEYTENSTYNGHPNTIYVILYKCKYCGNEKEVEV